VAAHAQIALIDKGWYETPEDERGARLERESLEMVEQERRTGRASPPEIVNPFPSWLRNLVKTKLGAHVSAKYDVENRMYRLTIKGGTDDADDVGARFAELYEQEAKGDPVKEAWRAAHHLRFDISSSEDSEATLLADLASHLGDKDQAESFRAGNRTRKGDDHGDDDGEAEGAEVE
jgi:hypothetical protein